VASRTQVQPVSEPLAADDGGDLGGPAAVAVSQMMASMVPVHHFLLFHGRLWRTVWMAWVA
jgi:hypothetical protein